MEGFRGKATAGSFAYGSGGRHLGRHPGSRGQARSRTVARADEGAQFLDVGGAHPKRAANAPHLEDVRAVAAAVLRGISRAAGLAGFRLWTGRMTPWLVAPDDGRLKRAAFGRPLALGALSLTDTRDDARRDVQAAAPAALFAVSTVCSPEFPPSPRLPPSLCELRRTGRRTGFNGEVCRRGFL